MKYSTIREFEKLNAFDFIKHIEVISWVKAYGYKQALRNPNNFYNKIYDLFIKPMETSFTVDEREYLALQVRAWVKDFLWKEIVDSKPICITNIEGSNTNLMRVVEAVDYLHNIKTYDRPTLQDFSLTAQTDRDNWFNERAGCITGSKLDKLLDVKATLETILTGKKKPDYLIKLARERKNGFAVEDDNDFLGYSAKRGIARENITRAWYENTYNELVFEVGFFKSRELEGIGCSLDGIVLGLNSADEVVVKKIVEIKNFISQSKLYAFFVEGDNKDIIKQVQYNMLLTNCPVLVQLIDTGLAVRVTEETFDIDFFVKEGFLATVLHNLNLIKGLHNIIKDIEGL
jgi:hypothetical protein